MSEHQSKEVFHPFLAEGKGTEQLYGLLFTVTLLGSRLSGHFLRFICDDFHGDWLKEN